MSLQWRTWFSPQPKRHPDWQSHNTASEKAALLQHEPSP
eukprot:CAMPEP_0172680270 /NCGR_PEP_ID=MMETSP1074-20121228/16658_1 /TAXON_ID=2916 /ORGANISM="Ceratium fusus, Strain PA161109" /LENGTH=38 /DNA_ID= /DNA_START= /DNA_END= /DNA_ORIENTATION=